jgi:amino acid adenylation domain-containing protein
MIVAAQRRAAIRPSLSARFDAVVLRYAERAAVIAADGALTFAELDLRSAGVAAAIGRRGLGAESVVGLCLSRGTGLVTGLLGVIRAGAAYLPLEPAYPSGRLAEMLADGGVSFVLADEQTVGRCAALPGVDVCRLADCPAADGFTSITVPPGSLLYTMYTSGSTGTPKGIDISHGAAVALLDALTTAGIFGAGPGRVGWNASICFDASVQQWLRLFRGDTLVVIDERVRTDPVGLAAFAREHALTDLDITPAHLALLADHLLPDHAPGTEPRRRSSSLLRLLVGGEALPATLWDRLRRLAEVGSAWPVNLYGPTECTVDATIAVVADHEAPTLGRPLSGVGLRLLDAAMVPVPDAAPGEIYLTGTGLARGYRGRPGATATHFVADPFAGDGSRMYRTGDLARRGADGRLEFLGRRDRQVKLRGYRIELGEIEAVLAGFPGISQAVAIVRDDCPGGPGLAAYYQAPGPVAVTDLRAAVATRLPEYMVPGVFVWVDRMPTTLSGKVDRARLPVPHAGSEFAADGRPSGPTEELVADAWCAVLGIEQVSATDNFFALGGQSLLAIRLAARLRRSLGLALPMVAVFENPYLRELAAYIDRVREDAGAKSGRGPR